MIRLKFAKPILPMQKALTVCDGIDETQFYSLVRGMVSRCLELCKMFCYCCDAVPYEDDIQAVY